jgi:hypothetical protein
VNLVRAPSRNGSALFLALASAGLLGCAGGGDGPSGGTGSGGSGGSGSGSDGVIPARVRRLTNAEYDASVQALLGTTQTLAATTFPPDSRQSNFSLNDAQRVDPVLAKALDDAGTALAAEARMNGTLARLAPCADTTNGGEACARTFIQSFVTKAYRHPVTSDDTDALVTVYHAGADGGTYNDGIDLVVRATLQSASFLYLTELGDPAAQGPMVTLTPYELASALSYLITSGPPDDTLLGTATSNGLASADGREAQARRLLQSSGARARLLRFVREWLGIDDVADTAKDTTVYPTFAGVRDSLDAESAAFVNEVMQSSNGSVSDLLGASWSVIDQNLATNYYNVPFTGTGMRTPLGARRGILNQGAFLSVYAHASESAPVLRGVAVLRRVACITIQSPTELNINVTPPVPDPTKTTRQRYDIHATDMLCKTCHAPIDSVGFTFEGFDGMGMARTMENNQPIDSTSTIALNGDFDGFYPDSNALAAVLAQSPSVRSCVARQVFRGSAGRSDSTVGAAENTFVNQWQQLPSDAQGQIIEAIVAYVRSPLFAQRSTQ